MRRQMFQLTDAAFDCKYAITWKAFLSNLVCPFLSTPPSPGAILPTCKLTSWRVRLLKSTHISLSQILSPSLLSQIIFLSLLTLMAWLIFRNNFRRLKIFLKARKNKLDADTAVCVSTQEGQSLVWCWIVLSLTKTTHSRLLGSFITWQRRMALIVLLASQSRCYVGHQLVSRRMGRYDHSHFYWRHLSVNLFCMCCNCKPPLLKLSIMSSETTYVT